MRTLTCLLLTLGCLSFCPTHAQFLKKLKQKAEQVVNGNTDANNQQNNNGNSQAGNASGNTASGTVGNKGGQGLIATPPDVKENLGTAETVFNQGKYSEARYAVQQAMLGVELQIGQQILKSLPETVSDLPFDAKADQVTSTGWGWAGLTIQRLYKKDDKSLRFTIANNAAWMQAINLYLNNVGYAQTTGGQQAWKQTRIKGYRAVIEYSESAGYKLSLPLGQTSLLVYEGVNYATEQDFTAAVNAIDIDSIKNKLGEK